jgi:hypothetical protein
MGACSSTSDTTEVPIHFSSNDIATTNAFIFDTVVNMALQMLEVEMVTKPDLMPPTPEILLGLCAVAAVDIAAAQTKHQTGIAIAPQGQTITKANCPTYFSEVLVPVIEMKDELVQVSNGGELAVGEINKIKQVVLFQQTSTPVKIWGSWLQKYEAVTDFARRAALATKRLPVYDTRSAEAAQRIDAALRSDNPPPAAVFKPAARTGRKADSDDEEEEEEEEVVQPKAALQKPMSDRDFHQPPSPEAS